MARKKMTIQDQIADINNKLQIVCLRLDKLEKESSRRGEDKKKK